MGHGAQPGNLVTATIPKPNTPGKGGKRSGTRRRGVIRWGKVESVGDGAWCTNWELVDCSNPQAPQAKGRGYEKGLEAGISNLVGLWKKAVEMGNGAQPCDHSRPQTPQAMEGDKGRGIRKV